MPKIPLGKNVLDAAKERISYIFDNVPKVSVSFSGGKDSTVLLHLVMEEAIARNKKVAVLFVDWEAQFDLTISHIRDMMNLYSDHIIPYWIQVPLTTTNGCSQYEPEWSCWDEEKKNLWIREKEFVSYNKPYMIPFYYDKMTFEEFISLWGKWYSEGEDTCCFVGIRAQESLNRFRAIAKATATAYKGIKWSTNVVDNVWNFYPIYDWSVNDIWTYVGKFRKCYNPLYDRMYQAGLTVNQMRVDEPFGETQRKGLWLYQIIEPKTWGKMVLRVAGANSGSLYSKQNGNVLGNRSVQLPTGYTWETFAKMLLDTMPKKTSEHYKNKISVYIKWYQDRGYENGIPDGADLDLEALGKVPSWRMICKTLLRNDYWCIGLGFGPTKRDAYDKYLALMRRRRVDWKIFEQVESE